MISWVIQVSHFNDMVDNSILLNLGSNISWLITLYLEHKNKKWNSSSHIPLLQNLHCLSYMSRKCHKRQSAYRAKHSTETAFEAIFSSYVKRNYLSEAKLSIWIKFVVWFEAFVVPMYKKKFQYSSSYLISFFFFCLTAIKC